MSSQLSSSSPITGTLPENSLKRKALDGRSSSHPPVTFLDTVESKKNNPYVQHGKYETRPVVHELCGEGITFRSELSLKDWDIHRSMCRASRGRMLNHTPESTAQALMNPPVKRRRAKRSEDERIEYLRTDPYVAQFEAYRVLCASCNKWIRLRPNSTYCSIPWDAHRKSCLSKKVYDAWPSSPPFSLIQFERSKRLHALSERTDLFGKDRNIREFDTDRVLCAICDKWILVGDVDHLQSVANWHQHRSNCEQSVTPSTSPTPLQFVSSGRSESTLSSDEHWKSDVHGTPRFLPPALTSLSSHTQNLSRRVSFSAILNPVSPPRTPRVPEFSSGHVRSPPYASISPAELHLDTEKLNVESPGHPPWYQDRENSERQIGPGSDRIAVGFNNLSRAHENYQHTVTRGLPGIRMQMNGRDENNLGLRCPQIRRTPSSEYRNFYEGGKCLLGRSQNPGKSWEEARGLPAPGSFRKEISVETREPEGSLVAADVGERGNTPPRPVFLHVNPSRGKLPTKRKARQSRQSGGMNLDSRSGRINFVFSSVEHLFATTYESTDDLSISTLLSYLNSAMPLDKHEDFDTGEVAKAAVTMQERGLIILEGDTLHLVG